MSDTLTGAASWVRWRVLGVVTVLCFISYMLRGNLSIAAPTMIEDLGLTELQWGWVAASFPLGYAIFQFPGGLLGDRLGPRKTLTIIAIAWAVLVAATAMVPGGSTSPSLVLAALIAVQLCVGVAHAPVFPVINVTIQRWFPPGGWAFPTGITSGGLTMGLAVAASLLPWLLASVGWRFAFLLLAPPAVLAALLWYWYSRDNPREHRAVNETELALIQPTGTQKEDSAAEPEVSTWYAVISNRNALLLTLSYSCMNFVFYVLFSWGFYYLVTVRGFEGQEAGFLTSVQWLFAGAGAILGGWSCDKLCTRVGVRWGCRMPVIVGMLLSGALLLGVALASNPLLAALMLGLCFFFNQTTEGAYWASSISIGGRHAGATGGLMNTGANLMGFVNALLLSLVADSFGWTLAITIGALFALVGAGLIFLVRADQQIS